MSTQVDSRVVEMRFDNRHFEENVSETLSTLDKLKRNLKLDGATEGLDKVSKAAGKVDLNPLGKSVEAVKVKFSALEVMAVTALSNITNSALNAGKRVMSALTIDPIKSGFSEYETQINAIQTILANTKSKGTDLNDVNSALDELNKYADKTIYNFTEMTRNIGTFTAAGIDLDTSVSAIKGIANLAAVSGSTSQQASTAMYQLSQALAAGTVKLMDWNSVVNAGMGGQVFQDALKETARVHGIAIDKMMEDEGSFRETLKLGWITSDVLLETLAKFTGDLNANQLAAVGYTKEQIAGIMDLGKTANDAATKVKTLTQLYDTLKEAAQSGWTQTWELIVGDFEEAKGLFTEISDYVGGLINATAEARNAIVKGAFGDVIDKFSDVTAMVNEAGIATEDFQKALIATAEAHGVNVKRMIEEEGSFEQTLKRGWLTKDLVAITLEKYTGSMAGATQATEDLNAKLKKFQDIVDRVWRGDFGNGVERIKALADAGYEYSEVQELVNKSVNGYRLKLEDLTEGQLASIGYTEEQIKAIKELAKQARISNTPLNVLLSTLNRRSGRELLILSFKNAFDGLEGIITAVGTAWRETFDSFTSEDLYKAIQSIYEFSIKLKMGDDTTQKLTRTFKGLFAAIDLVLSIINAPFKLAFEIARVLLEKFDMKILDFTANIGDAIVEFNDWIKSQEIYTKIAEKVVPWIEAMVDGVDDLIVKFKELPLVKSIVESVGDVTASVTGGVKAYFTNGNEAIDEFVGRVKSLDKITLTGVVEIFGDFVSNVAGKFVDFNGLYESAKTTVDEFKTSIDESLGDSSAPVAEANKSMAEIGATLKKVFTPEIVAATTAIGAGGGLIYMSNKLATSIKGALTAFSLHNFLGIASTISQFNNLLKHKSLLNLALAIGVLAASLALLSFIDWQDLAIGAGVLTLLGVALIGLSAAQKAFGDEKQLGISMMAIAGAVILLVGAMKLIDTMDAGSIKKSLGVLLALGLGLSTVVRMLASTKGGAKGAWDILYLVSFALSLKLLVSTLDDIGGVTMSIRTLGKIGALMLMLSAVAAVTSKVKSTAFLTVLAVPLALKLFMETLNSISTFDVTAIMNNMDGLVLILGMFSGLMVLSSFAGKHSMKVAVMFVAVIAAIHMLIGAVKRLTDISPKELAMATASVMGLMAMVSVLLVMSEVSGEHSVKAGIMLLAASGAILILVGIVGMVSQMDPKGLLKGMIVVELLGLMLATILYSSWKAQGTIGALITITVIIGMLIGVLALFSSDSFDTNKVTKASAAISLLMLSFSVIARSLKSNTIKMSEMKPMLKYLTSMAILMGILTVVVAAMSFLPDTTAAMKNTVALGILLNAFASAVLILSHSKQTFTVSTSVLHTMAGIVAVLGMVLGAMSLFPQFSSSIANAVAIGTLLNALASAFLIASNAKPMLPAAESALWNMAAITGVLAFVLGMMSMFPQFSNVIANAVAIGVLLNAMASAMLIASRVPLISKSAEAGMLVMSVVAGLAAVIIGMLTSYATNLEYAIPAAVAVGALILAMSYAMVPLSAVGKMAGTATLGAAELILVTSMLGVFIGAVAEMFGEMNQLDFDKLQNGVGRLFDVIGTVVEGIAEVVARGVGTLIEGVLPPIGTALSRFAENAKEFTSVMVAVDSSSVGALADFLGAIALIFAGKAFSDIVSYFTGSKDMDLGVFAEKLVPFGQAMVEFSDTVAGKINADALEAAKNAAEVLAKLQNALPNVGGVWQYLVGENMDMAVFGHKLVYFGEAMVEFSKTVNGKINKESVEAAANSGLILADLASSLPKTGGKLQEWLGTNMDMQAFGIKIKQFAYAIVDFSRVVSGGGGKSIVNSKAVEAAANAGLMLSDLANSLPTVGGKIAEWFGETMDLGTFGKQLETFGWSIAFFSNIVSGRAGVAAIDENAIGAAARAGQAMAALANSLPEADSKLSDWFGGNTIGMDEFGYQLQSFGESFASYATSIKDIDPNVVTASANAATAMAKLYEILPDPGTFTNEMWLDEFGADINEFGSHFYAFYNDSIRHVDMDMMSSAIAEIKKIAYMLHDLNSIDSTTAANSFKTTMEALSDAAVDEFVDEFYNSYDRVDKALNDFLGNAVKVLSDSKHNFRTPANDQMDSFITGIKEKSSYVQNACTTILEQSYTAMNAYQVNFWVSGKTVMAGFIQGIHDKLKALRDLIKGIFEGNSEATGIIPLINSYQDEFITAGQYLGDGLVQGMENRIDSVAIKAAAMMRAAIVAAEAEAGIHSPAKEGIEMGQYLGEGVGVGLDNISKWVQDKAAGLMGGTVDSMYGTFDSVDISDQAETTGESLVKSLESQVEALKTWIAEINKLSKRGLNSALFEELRQMGPSSLEQIREINRLSDKELRKYEELWGQSAYLTEVADTAGLDQAFAHSLKWIQAQKDMSSLSLIDELSAWKRVSARYAEGTYERIYADEMSIAVQDELESSIKDYYSEVTSVQKQANEDRAALDEERYEKTKEINERLEADIKALEQEYDDAIKSRTQELSNAWGLFGRADTITEMDGTALTENLQGQIEALDIWINDINSLASRGVTGELLDELRKMGPSSATQIKALNNMTDDQLNQYVSLWQQKYELANSQAIFELQDMREETNNQIAQLRAEAAAELDEYEAIWDAKLQEINNTADTKLAELKNNWLTTIRAIAEETSSEVDFIIREMNKLGNKDGWSESGANSLEGYISGMVQTSSKVSQTAIGVGQKVLDVFNKTIGVNSPSTKFYESAVFSLQGYINGIRDNIGSVASTVTDVGSTTLDTLRETIANIDQIINGEMDLAPTIRPVIDLSNVTSGARRLSTLLSHNRALAVDSDITNAKNPTSNNQNGIQNGGSGNVYNFNQYNHSPKALQRSEIYRQTKNQFSAFERLVEK